MKLAIVSDVHSNLHALEAVMKEIDRIGPEMVACAGDLVGYGAFPNECCEILKARASKTVKGNHDCAVLEKDPSGANPYAARAILWTADIISTESRRFLEGLSTESRFPFEGKSIAMFHGSPANVDDYVFEYDADDELVESTEADVLILGHTHIPCIKRLESGLFINPGAVGQPRDGEWRASYAVLDSETNECSIRRVPYDLTAAAEAIRKAGLPGILAERLYYGT
jgi:putative phosphoesterase